jgi:cellulose synthase/poly-beta-1,6-N-acetylglucosamine synthase-like glycosyltransferase
MTGCWLALASAAALISLPGSIELLLLIVGSIFPRSRRFGRTASSLERMAVVIPAHNEEATIARTIKSLRDADIVVIADNCSDRTAEIARENGARVLVRDDAAARGKGYALDFAFRTLLAEGYDAFLVVDADTVVAPNFVTELAHALRAGADAVQARYLLLDPDQSVRTRLISVGNRAFNVFRARGRERLGLSCGVYGNGFGLRRETLEQVPYLASSTVEDLEYHLALVRSGRRIRFIETTSVYGETPSARRAATSQRTRWEGGRLRMIREHAPGLAKDVLRGHWACLEPLLDLLLLPLAFHVVLLLVAASAPFGIVRMAGLIGLALTVTHLGLALLFADGTWKEALALCAAPAYIVWKLLLLPALARASGANARWVRTERNLHEGAP